MRKTEAKCEIEEFSEETSNPSPVANHATHHASRTSNCQVCQPIPAALCLPLAQTLTPPHPGLLSYKAADKNWV